MTRPRLKETQGSSARAENVSTPCISIALPRLVPPAITGIHSLMNEASSERETRRRMLEAGALVILHPDGPAGGFPLVVAVDQVSKGFHWFLGSIDPIRKGETLIVESPVPKDARYVTHGTVMAASAETFALRLEPEWERVQQRAFVRISAHGLRVRVVRLNPPRPSDREAGLDMTSGDSVHELVDISAGGVRFLSNEEYEAGEEVVCHFELPGSLCFVLPARAVRARETPAAPSAKPGVAVEFMGLDETNRSQLLRWVYREQVRRHREEERQEARERKRREARESRR